MLKYLFPVSLGMQFQLMIQPIQISMSVDWRQWTAVNPLSHKKRP